MSVAPVRILLALPGAELYGSDRVAVQTVRALLAAGHRVTATTPTDGPLVAVLRTAGADVVICPAPVVRRSGLTPRGALVLAGTVAASTPRMLGLLRRVRPDVVVVNTQIVPLWIVLARGVGARVVCHVHEAEAGVRPLLRRLLTAPLLLADGVVVNSGTTREVLARSWPRTAAHAVLVRNPVPGPPDAPGRPAAGAPRLVYVGRLSERKGVHVALDAAALVRAGGQDLRVELSGAAFAGGEGYVRALEARAARPDLAGAVTFHGFEDDVWARYAAATVVVVPSTSDESYGNTAVEAVLAARPVVVSAQPGLVEATGGYRGVVIVEPGDAAALAGAVETVLADPDRWQAAAAADAPVAARRNAPARYRHDVERAVRAAAAVRSRR